MKAQSLIVNGARWRVGDGGTIRNYKDNWLPGEGNGRVTPPLSFLPKDCTVSSLIDEESKWWNTTLNDSLFLPDVARNIKSIPLCVSSQSDRLCWLVSTNCLYYVKTGYHSLCEGSNSALASGQPAVSSKIFCAS